jgi:uncharacterized protein (TIGR02147 family)
MPRITATLGGARMTVSVFNFTDYRQFLRQSIAGKKAENPHVSYRAICEKTGIKSKGHLALILQGKTKVSIPFAIKLAEFLKLKKREMEYFQYLVLFNQAKNHQDKKAFFEKMMSFKESSVRIIDSNQYEYYDRWYHSAIRAILEFYPFDNNFVQLAKMVEPAITADEAEKSIALMERLGLIAKDGGRYRPVDRVIDSGSEANSLSVNNVAIQTLRLAEQAIDRFPREERMLSGVALGISEKGYQAAIAELRDFRQRIYTIVENDDANRIYQLNIQLFPLSKRYVP